MKPYTLSDAIYDSKYASYFLYRLRYFFVISLTTLLITFVELSLIRDFFPTHIIAEIIFTRLFVGILAGGWWGALEILREYVRGRYHFAKLKSIQIALSNWICLSLLVAVGIACIPLPYFLNLRKTLDPVDRQVFDLYLLGFIVHSLIEFGVTAYHSGIYAIRRIFRPISLVLSCGVVTITLLHFLWQMIGIIGVPIAFIIGELYTAGVRIYCIRRTSKDLRIPELTIPRLHNFRKFISELPFVNATLSYLAGISLYLENSVILFYFKELRLDAHLLIYLFILRQIYRAYSHFGALFYYDFKKMRTGAFPPFYKGFLKRFIPLSLAISLVFFLITIAFTAAFHPSFLKYSHYMAIFFLMATFVSFVQIHAFSQNCYKDLIVSGIFAMSTFFFGNIYVFIASLPLISLYLSKPHLLPTFGIDSIKKQSVYSLVLQLDPEKDGYQIIKFRVYPMYIDSVALNEFLNKLSLAIDLRGWLCPLKTNEYLLIEPNQAAKVTPSELMELSAGLMQSSSFSIVQNREQCLERVFEELTRNISRNRFYRESQALPHRPLGTSLYTLDHLFQYHFPGEKTIDLKHFKFSEDLFAKPNRNALYNSIEEFSLYPLSRAKRLPFQCSFLFVSSPKLYFMKKERKNRQALFQWGEFMHYLNFKNFAENGYHWKP